MQATAGFYPAHPGFHGLRASRESGGPRLLRGICLFRRPGGRKRQTAEKQTDSGRADGRIRMRSGRFGLWHPLGIFFFSGASVCSGGPGGRMRGPAEEQTGSGRAGGVIRMRSGRFGLWHPLGIFFFGGASVCSGGPESGRDGRLKSRRVPEGQTAWSVCGAGGSGSAIRWASRPSAGYLSVPADPEAG